MYQLDTTGEEWKILAKGGEWMSEQCAMRHVIGHIDAHDVTEAWGELYRKYGEYGRDHGPF